MIGAGTVVGETAFSIVGESGQEQVLGTNFCLDQGESGQKPVLGTTLHLNLLTRSIRIDGVHINLAGDMLMAATWLKHVRFK